VPDFRLLEVRRVFGILQLDHNMVWEEREVLQRLDTKIEVLVTVHNDRRYLGEEGKRRGIPDLSDHTMEAMTLYLGTGLQPCGIVIATMYILVNVLLVN